MKPRSRNDCTVKSTPETPRKVGGSKFKLYAGLDTVNPSDDPVPAENSYMLEYDV